MAFEAGGFGVPIDVRLPLDRVADASELMRRSAHFGKIVLTRPWRRRARRVSGSPVARHGSVVSYPTIFRIQ